MKIRLGTGKIGIAYWALGKIKKLPRNAKEHDLEEIILSIQTYGFVDPIGVNEVTGHDIDGNGRREALAEMKKRRLPAPRGITVSGNRWHVPVVTGIRIPKEKEEAFALELNRTNERGGVNETILAAILQDLAQREEGLQGSGYNQDDLQSLLLRLKEAAAQEGPASPGDGPKAPVPSQRVRFMRLAGGGELSRHADITDREAGLEDGRVTRLHIPIVSNPGVVFEGWDARGVRHEMHFAPRGLFYLDQRKPHRVRNVSGEERIHLVIDCHSSPELRALFSKRSNGKK